MRKALLAACLLALAGSMARADYQPGPVPLTGDVSGTTDATVAPRWRPAWTSVVLTAAGVTLPPGYAVYDLTGGGMLASATVRLPAAPVDRDTVRLVAMGALAVTLLTVQDSGGGAVQTAFGLGSGGTALYQFQGTAWVRVGS